MPAARARSPLPQLEEDIAAKEKLLRASEDERDRVLEELHKAEDSLLAADGSICTPIISHSDLGPVEKCRGLSWRRETEMCL